MTAVERTAQRLDPLGTYSAWMLPAAAGVVAFGYAVVSTIRHGQQVVSLPLAILGLAFVLAGAVIFTWAAVPTRAPFTRRRMLAVLALTVCGAVSFALSTWGMNRMVQDDWGQVATGVLILGMAQLRPPRELIVVGLVIGILLGALATAQATFLAIPVSPIVYGLVAATPPIALACGAAAFGGLMLRATERWQKRALKGMARLEPEIRESVTRAVQQEYVTELNRSAAPLLERIAAIGEVTERDIHEAMAAARDLRARAIGTLHSSWLDDMVARTGIRQLTAVTLDADRAALEAVTVDQRAVLAAAVNTLVRAPDCTVTELVIAAPGPSGTEADQARRGSTAPGRIGPSGTTRGRIELIATLTALESPRALRSLLMPYLSVLRVVSADARLVVEPGRVTLGFAHERD